MNFTKENSPHVTWVVNLEIGEEVRILKHWGARIGGKKTKILDIKLAEGATQTGILVLTDIYDSYIDSAWIEKIL